jgi:hypothetical protein
MRVHDGTMGQLPPSTESAVVKADLADLLSRPDRDASSLVVGDWLLPRGDSCNPQALYRLEEARLTREKQIGTERGGKI